MERFKKTTAVFLSLILTSCSTTVEVPTSESTLVKPEAVTQQVTPVTVDEDTVYSVYLDFGWDMEAGNRSGNVYMDRDGNLIPKEEIMTELHDIVTGEVVAKTVSKTEDTGKDDEYGYPITVTYTQLYDKDEKLLRDWEKVSYSAAYNGLLIRSDTMNMYEMPDENFYAELWDTKTDKTVIEDVFQLNKVDDEHILALDAQGLLLGMLDDNAKPVAGFPVAEKYYHPTVNEGRILASTHDPYNASPTKDHTYRLLDYNLDTVFETQQLNISYYALVGPYATYTTDSERGILSLETLKPVYIYENPNDNVNYYDGELVIVRNGSRQTQEWSSRLYKADKTPLTDEYDEITFDDGNLRIEEPAPYFLARKGDELHILSRSGKVVFSNTFSGLENAYINGGYIEYGVETPDGFKMGLLDKELNVIISAEENEYYSVSRKVDYSNGKKHPTNVLTATRYNAADEMRTDILTLDGSPIVTDLSAVGTVTDEAIAVIRGFNFGLIDYNGEWISKYSIYNDVNLD